MLLICYKCAIVLSINHRNWLKTHYVLNQEKIIWFFMKLDSVLEVHQLLESFFDILNSAELHFNYFHKQSEVHAV